MSVKGSSVLGVGGEISSLAKYSIKASSTGESAVEGVIDPRGGGDATAWFFLRTGVSRRSIFIAKLRLLAAVGCSECIGDITDEVI